MDIIQAIDESTRNAMRSATLNAAWAEIWNGVERTARAIAWEEEAETVEATEWLEDALEAMIQ